MKNRFQELLAEVGTDVSGKWVSTENTLRLAELIVRECAERVDWILAEGGKTQGDLIKQHFGVE
jgi:hypothetical protein